MDTRYRWVILGVLWISFIVVFLARLSVGPLGPFLKAEFQITSAQLGLVLSAASFGYLASQLPIGVFADRVGARWPIAVGEFIAGFSMLAIFLVPSYTSLLTLMFLTGVGCGFIAPCTTQGVMVWFPKNERATVMGFKQTAVNVGGMIGAATLPAVALAFGWRYGFFLLGWLAIAVGIASAALYREPSSVPGDMPRNAPADPLPLREVLRNRQIWLVGLGAFCLNWIELSMIGHVVLYLQTLHFPVVAAGGVLAMAEGAGALARPISGFMSDRIFGGRRNPIFLVFAVTATLMCLVLGVAGPHLGWMLYPVLFFLGIGGVGFGGVFLTLLAEFGGPRGAAKAAALGSTVSMFGSILGPPAFGHIADVTGSYQIAWLSLAAVGGLGITALLFVRESERKG
jgi:ACS family hexuronate transporter-like MFS transporter